MHRIERGEAASVNFEFDGEKLTARDGDTVAAALLAAEHSIFRTTAVSGRKRGPFCMMGVCFDCLVEIDGVANRQACMTRVQEGMQVKRQHGASDINLDQPTGDELNAL